MFLGGIKKTSKVIKAAPKKQTELTVFFLSARVRQIARPKTLRISRG
jgi:hypothetical protein